MRSLRQVCPVLIAGLGAAVAVGAAGAQAPAGGNATMPLTLRATCELATQTLHVQLANTGDRPTAIVVGFIPPNARAQVVNSVDVIAVRIATGADEDYVYVNPKFALASGTPWIVSLAPGATHQMDLPLKDFISSLNYSPLDTGTAGGTRLVFEGRAAPKPSTQVWTGKVQTVLAPCS